MGNISYQDMIDVVQNFYQNSSTPDKWVEFTQGGITPEKLEVLESIGVHTTLSPSGNVLGYDYAGTLPAVGNPVTALDSNVQTGLYGDGALSTYIPGNAVTDSQTGVTTMTSGLKNALTGTTVSTLGGTVFLATAGVSIATKLGKAIDSAIYSIAPDWWDEHYPTINPSTWDDIITEDMEGAQLFRSVFGIEDDNTTMYLDEKALAYTYAMLLENGAWDASGNPSATYDPPAGVDVSGYTQPILLLPGSAHIVLQGTSNVYREYQNGTAEYIALIQRNKTSGNPLAVLYLSSQPFTFETKTQTGNWSTVSSSQKTTLNNTPYYYSEQALSGNYFHNSFTYYGYTPNIYNPGDSGSGLDSRKVATIVFDGTVVTPSPVEGIDENPEAGYQIVPSNVINQTTGQPATPQDNIDDILQALKLAYPDLFTGAIYEDVMQPDGSIDRHTYVPSPMPVSDTNGKPITDTTEGIDPQQNPEVNPENRTEGQLQNLTESITEDPTAPDTGGGASPPLVPPSGTANALYSIYNPSQGELNAFGAWLWSSNFVDQLLKLFNDPMQAIIGLHKVFVTPTVSGRQNIRVGYLDSGVASNVVGAQYETVSCGSISISEYFGNVFDYDPFTQIYLYLPFVGIERLDTGDVMRSTLNVVYHVDVLTGACLAEVNVFRDGGGGVLYTYTGNCAVQYPISSGSYMGIVASLASVVGGVVGTIATGGALAPVALGAVSGVMNAHTRVEHSGGFSGNAGAMGIKKPYVIITRPQTCLADNFPAFNGYPANKLAYISECSGYIKCNECHIEQVPGTDAELSELETLLKSGIIV